MSPHVDILEQQERLRRPLLVSLTLHTAILASLLVIPALRHGAHVNWGDPNAGGGFGSIAVNVVKQIPLPTRGGEANPLANDSQFTVPAPPVEAKPRPRRTPAEDAGGVPIKSKGATERAQRPEARRSHRAGADAPNQVYSSSGQALVSPMYGMTGGGGVGVGPNSVFGTRFGSYVEILKSRVAQRWRTSDVDARVRTAPVVIVTFILMRNGSVRDVRVAQRSGILTLDMSAQRAIYDAAPFPPIPEGYEPDRAVIEFWFELRR